MADLPIIFSAPMILALLREAQEPGADGGKTMTRRTLYSARKEAGRSVDAIPADHIQRHPPPNSGPFQIDGKWHHWALTGWHKVKAGDRLWVRESGWWSIGTVHGRECRMTCYRAGHNVQHSPATDGKWRPSIHMPRWASRLTLICTADARIERLQDITEADSAAEGITTIPRSLTRHGRMDGYGLAGTPPEDASPTRGGAFCKLWMSLHGQDSWLNNPWVVVLSFRIILANIDSERAAA